jgi:hypothetical protein
MTLENTETQNDRAIREAADKIISSTCQKHGTTPDQLPAGAIDDARRVAAEMVESDVRNQQNEYYLLYEAQKKEMELLKAQLGAVRENKVARTDNRTVDSMERVRDQMGRATWFQLSRDQKVASLGVEPSSVDMVQLRALFGKHTDTALAVDFMKTNPYRYRQLREVALALDVTGK